jgi:hypothetical protein
LKQKCLGNSDDKIFSTSIIVNEYSRYIELWEYWSEEVCTLWWASILDVVFLDGEFWKMGRDYIQKPRMVQAWSCMDIYHKPLPYSISDSICQVKKLLQNLIRKYVRF